MQNTIEANIKLSFQGKHYDLSSTINLNQLMEDGRALHSIYALLAKEHDIDTYSYLYEMMEMENIAFKNAQGMASEFLNDHAFNFEQFSTAWQNQKIVELLSPIAIKTLGITDLDNHPALKNALIAAYHLGKQK